jgi:hypothetical protein
MAGPWMRGHTWLLVTASKSKFRVTCSAADNYHTTGVPLLMEADSLVIYGAYRQRRNISLPLFPLFVIDSCTLHCKF